MKAQSRGLVPVARSFLSIVGLALTLSFGVQAASAGPAFESGGSGKSAASAGGNVSLLCADLSSQYDDILAGSGYEREATEPSSCSVVDETFRALNLDALTSNASSDEPIAVRGVTPR